MTPTSKLSDTGRTIHITLDVIFAPPDTSICESTDPAYNFGNKTIREIAALLYALGERDGFTVHVGSSMVIY